MGKTEKVLPFLLKKVTNIKKNLCTNLSIKCDYTL